MTADGSIRIVTRIDITDAKLKLKQLQAELKRADKAVETAQKNLAKNMEKTSQYSAERAAVQQARSEELTKAGDDVQRQAIYEMFANQMKDIDAKYEPYHEAVGKYSVELEEAKRIQAQLNEEVLEQIGVVQNLTATQERQTQEAKESARAEREKARAIKETEQASKKFETSAHRVGRKILSWGTAMLAVRGVMGILRKSVNAFMNDNQAVANQIASIWSTLGAALAPIINRIVSLITTAVSIVAAFIKALTGIDIVANANAKALENQAGATAGAGSAAEKAEKQLAGFDEMNKLSDTSASSGGGGGGGGIDTANLFEPTELSEKTMAQIQWVADHFKDLLWYAGAIGAAIATWKIASTFGAGLKTIIGLMMTVYFTVLFVKEFIDAWINGIDFSNMTGMITNAIGAITGLGIAFGWVGAVVGALVFGIAMLVVGIKDWITTGELSAETCAMLSTAILLIGGAISVLTGSFIPLIIAAVAWIALTVIAYWDDIKVVLKAAVDWIKDKWEELVQKISDFFAEIDETMDAWADACIETITTWASKTKKKITDMATNGKARFEDFRQDTITKFQNIRNKANETFTNITTSISTAVNKFKSKFDEFKNKVINVYNIIRNKFSSLGTAIGSAISGAVRTAINGVLSKIQNTINSAVNIINGVIGVINLLPGVSASYLSPVYLPRLAKGGIVNNPGMGVTAVIGEAGAEAVLPLERNTGWMDTLADKIASKGGAGGPITIPIYLSGRKVAEYIVDLTTREAFATNRA